MSCAVNFIARGVSTKEAASAGLRPHLREPRPRCGHRLAGEVQQIVTVPGPMPAGSRDRVRSPSGSPARVKGSTSPTSVEGLGGCRRIQSPVKRRLSDEQLVQNQPQRVDVGYSDSGTRRASCSGAI